MSDKEEEVKPTPEMLEEMAKQAEEERKKEAELYRRMGEWA